MCEDALEDAGDETELLWILSGVHDARLVRYILNFSVIVGSLHRESLTRSRLSIGDEAAVVALQERVRDGNANAFEDVQLTGIMVVNMVVAILGVAL